MSTKSYFRSHSEPEAEQPKNARQLLWDLWSALLAELLKRFEAGSVSPAVMGVTLSFLKLNSVKVDMRVADGVQRGLGRLYSLSAINTGFEPDTDAKKAEPTTALNRLVKPTNEEDE